MREATFNTEVVNSIKKLGGWAHKITDLPASKVIGMAFTPEKPCDIVGAYYGKFIGIESKQLKKFSAIGRNQLQYSQIKNLNEMVDKKNRAFLFINIRIKAGGGKKHENRLIPLDWKEWRDYFDTATLKQKQLMDLPFIQGSKGFFDLTEILKGL